MLNLLSVLQANRLCPRYYIAAATDDMSLQKARVFEDSLVDKVMVILDPCKISISEFSEHFFPLSCG